MTKRAQSKLWRLQDWDDGSRRSYAEPTVVNPEPNPVPVFPRVASVWIGSPHNYDLATYQQGAAQFDLVFWTLWETWGQGRAVSFAQACANAKALNPNLKIYQYVNPYDILLLDFPNLNPLLISTADAQNWWLRDSYPSGPRVYSSTYNANIVNTRADIPNKLNGQSCAEWIMSTYSRDMFINGVYSSQFGRPQANPSLDGLFYDNILMVSFFNGDYDCNGTLDNSNDLAQSQKFREGYAAGADAYRAALPSKNLTGNLNFMYLVTYNPWGLPIPEPVYNKKFDFGLYEHFCGTSYSAETWGTPAIMLQAAKVHADMLIDPFSQVLHVNRLYTLTSTNFQDFRHGICAALCATDGYITYCDVAQDNYGSTTGFNRTAQWFDEYDNAGTQKYYLGSAIDARISTTWTQGVYRRRFANGWVLWNPKGNGTQTLSLGQTMRKIQGRSGYSDTAVNNGATVTSVTLQDRDGLVLLNGIA